MLSASSGTIVTVEVTDLDSDYQIESVNYNDTSCSMDTSGSYYFTMPDKDVTLSATVSETKEVTKTSYASLASYSSKTIARNKGTAKLYVGLSFNYMTILKSDFTISNTTVMPYSSVSISTETASQSNLIVGAYINIDSTKLSLGSTFMTLDLNNGNVSSQKTALVLKLTIADSVSVMEWTEKLVFDVSGLSSTIDTYKVSLSDADYVPGSDNEATAANESLTPANQKCEFSFTYTATHRYYINFYSGEKGSYVFYVFDDTVGEGSSITGFNQYKNNHLTFVKDNSALNLVAKKENS